MDDTTQTMRQPYEGEEIDTWMWVEELDDCLHKGYTLDAVFEGYCFPELSDFMEPWSDLLWDYYQQADDTLVKDIYKQMMVGLPGRFLKSPESFRLIHASEHQRGDIPILATHWKEHDMVARPWFLRPEFDVQSAQLTPIGSYIVMKCRQELYHVMQAEEQAGNTVVSSYIDCYTTTEETMQPLGIERGEWKLKESYSNVWAEDNRIIPEDIERMRSPGTSGKERLILYYMYQGKEQPV
jgi:hypothetical protein